MAIDKDLLGQLKKRGYVKKDWLFGYLPTETMPAGLLTKYADMLSAMNESKVASSPVGMAAQTVAELPKASKQVAQDVYTKSGAKNVMDSWNKKRAETKTEEAGKIEGIDKNLWINITQSGKTPADYGLGEKGAKKQEKKTEPLTQYETVKESFAKGKQNAMAGVKEVVDGAIGRLGDDLPKMLKTFFQMKAAEAAGENHWPDPPSLDDLAGLSQMTPEYYQRWIRMHPEYQGVDPFLYYQLHSKGAGRGGDCELYLTYMTSGGDKTAYAKDWGSIKGMCAGLEKDEPILPPQGTVTCWYCDGGEEKSKEYPGNTCPPGTEAWRSDLNCEGATEKRPCYFCVDYEGGRQLSYDYVPVDEPCPDGASETPMTCEAEPETITCYYCGNAGQLFSGTFLGTECPEGTSPTPLTCPEPGSGEVTCYKCVDRGDDLTVLVSRTYNQVCPSGWSSEAPTCDVSELPPYPRR